MAHRFGITAISVFKNARVSLKRGVVTTNASEKPMLDGKPLEADVIVIATGVRKAEMFPRIVKPISAIMGINFLYKSTPQGSDDFDMGKIPCWIEHGQGLFGIPSLEGSGVKVAVVIPNTPIDINKDERIIEKQSISKTRTYIRHRLPWLEAQSVVDGKFNLVILTPDTHFIVDRNQNMKIYCWLEVTEVTCSNTALFLVLLQLGWRWAITALLIGSRSHGAESSAKVNGSGR